MNQGNNKIYHTSEVTNNGAVYYCYGIGNNIGQTSGISVINNTFTSSGTYGTISSNPMVGIMNLQPGAIAIQEEPPGSVGMAINLSADLPPNTYTAASTGTKGFDKVDSSRDVTLSPDRPHSEYCIICCERAKTIAFDPCGHFICCFTCTKKLGENRQGRPPCEKIECPECRAKVDNILRVYTN